MSVSINNLEEVSYENINRSLKYLITDFFKQSGVIYLKVKTCHSVEEFANNQVYFYITFNGGIGQTIYDRLRNDYEVSLFRILEFMEPDENGERNYILLDDSDVDDCDLCDLCPRLYDHILSGIKELNGDAVDTRHNKVSPEMGDNAASDFDDIFAELEAYNEAISIKYPELGDNDGQSYANKSNAKNPCFNPKEKILCECGKPYTKANRSRHFKLWHNGNSQSLTAKPNSPQQQQIQQQQIQQQQIQQQQIQQQQIQQYFQQQQQQIKYQIQQYFQEYFQQYIQLYLK